MKVIKQRTKASPVLSWLGKSLAGRSRALWAAGILILAAITRLTSLEVFLANDETQYWEWSRTFFFALLRGDWAGTVVGPGNPSVTLFWNHALNMGVKYAWAWLHGIQATALATWPDFQPTATLDLLVERRVPIVLINTLAVVVAYYLVHRLYGRKVAILAALLLALDPFYLADSRTSRGEGLFASFVILAILLYLTYWVFGQSRYLILSGIIAGLALLTKTPGVSLVGWTMLATLAVSFWGPRQPGISKRSQLRRMAAAWGVWALSAIVTYWVVWPAMWTAPGKALGFVLSFVDNVGVGVGGRENYFFGQVYQDEPLPLFYLVVYVLRVTPLAWLGLLAAVVYLGRVYLRRPSVAAGEPGDACPVLTLLILGFALIYGAMMTVGDLKRDWYLIPAFPALDIVAAVGLVWLFDRVWEHWGKHRLAKIPAQVAWGGGLVAVLALQALTVLPSHPYYYTYWNPLVLGNTWAPDAVRIGWDLDLSAGADYLNTKPHAEDLRVATRSTHGFEQIFKGQTVRWVTGEPWIQADYLILRTNHIQRQKIDPETLAYVSHLKVDHVVNLGGVDYLWVYVGPHAEYFAGSTLVGKATLLGFDVDNQAVASGETLRIKLYWQNAGMTPADDLFLRLVDPSGYVWAEAVAAPLPGFEDANRTADQYVESQVVLTVPVGTPPGTYLLSGGVYSRDRKEALGSFELPSEGDRIAITRPAATPAAVPPMGHTLGTKMSAEISLLGFDLVGDTLVLSHDNWLTLYWRADADVSKDYAIALRLLNSEGKEAVYWLGRPAMSGYPTNKWTVGEIVRDPWRLSFAKDFPAGRYTLELEVYEGDTGRSVGKTTLGQVTVVAAPASQ